MFEDLKKVIEKSQKVGIFTHENPDGDALGSSFSMLLALRQMGKEARVFLGGFDMKTKEAQLVFGKDKMSDISVDDCDTLIALDCADYGRISAPEKEKCEISAAIDHHITHKPYAKVTCAPDAPAAGQVVFELLKDMKVSITPDIASNLYMAIACDTGNFKYAATTPKTHRIAAELIESGAEFAMISREIFYKKSAAYFKLLQKALTSLEFFENGKIAVLYLSKEDFDKAGLTEEQSGDIVTVPNRVEGVECGVFIRNRDNGFKVSLRSSEYTDVSKIAEAFGGGGHIRAAGFSSNLPLDELKAEILKGLSAAL